MNIAMFADSYKPQVNGMVTSIELFTKALRRKNRVAIFAPEISGAKPEKDVFHFESFTFTGYREYRIGVPYTLISNPKIKKIKFDVVHVHSPFSIGVAGLAFAKYYKLPVIGTFHTMFPDYMHYFIKSEKLQRNAFIKKLYKLGSWSYMTWFYNRCDIVIAPSENTRRILKEHGIRKKIVVIPTGIEIENKKLSRSDLRKKYKIGNEKIVLHVGRITKEKNIKFIIKSLRHLLKGKNVKMIITSDGPYKKELEEYVYGLNLDKKITFTGYVTKEKLRELYTISDVFVMASKTETQGLVLAEAAVESLPMVVLDAPVISDFVKETKTGVVSTEKYFAKNVENVIHDEALRKKLAKNCKNVAKNYDIKKCANDLLSLYKSL
jgi:glycosyltransferase involved in cell wall biosynthesis